MQLSIDPSEHSRSSSSPYYISVLLPSAVLGGLLIVTLAIQVILSWQSHRRLVPVSGHTSHMVKLQSLNFELQQELIESLRDKGNFTDAERVRLHNELKAILDRQAHLVDDTPQALSQTQKVLADARLHPREALILALSNTRRVINQEGRAHQKLIQRVSRATALELQIGVLTLVVFPSGVLLLLYLMRQRILAPLNRLSFLMTLLARRDYSPAPVADIDPMLRPLTENYNAMVTRLSALEQEHALREQDLESQVQTATRALLEQQRSLANTERLAAVGEMMARIAHELRNPLAGVKMACANLRQELSQVVVSADYVQRIDAVASEIDRIIAVLNSLLDQSRHRPQPLRDIAVGQTVADLVVLMRYQIPTRIRLEQRIPENIVCRLPDALLKQALLNLILNAQQAIGDHKGVIVISADVKDGRLRLSVCDDGPGFPQELLEAGIRTFVTHRPNGTGLGLSMVQRFARAHEGHVNLYNVEPQGACITLDLPCGGNHV
jgi:two-component system NtrC family sensor kinase